MSAAVYLQAAGGWVDGGDPAALAVDQAVAVVIAAHHDQVTVGEAARVFVLVGPVHDRPAQQPRRLEDFSGAVVEVGHVRPAVREQHRSARVPGAGGVPPCPDQGIPLGLAIGVGGDASGARHRRRPRR